MTVTEKTAADLLREYQAAKDNADQALADYLWLRYIEACQREIEQKRRAA
jgi:hypothetical protein